MTSEVRHLARLRQAHGFKILLAVDPALQAVDADLYPYVFVYAERDRFGILIPGDWRPGFEVFDLALRLQRYSSASRSRRRPWTRQISVWRKSRS